MRIKVNSKELRQLVNSIDRYDERCMTAINLYGDVKARDLEEKAKKTAKWTDRTGRARKSIEGKFRQNKKSFTLTLSGHALDDYDNEYFQYLERGKMKKYSILEPTIRENVDDVVDGAVELISKIEL